MENNNLNTSEVIDNEKCDQCDNYLDEYAEHGTCYTCLLNSCIAGQYSELMD